MSGDDELGGIKSESTKIPRQPSVKKNKESEVVENKSFMSKLINLQTTISSKRDENASRSDKMKVNVAQRKPQFVGQDASTQITDELNSKEVILTEEKLEEIKESIVSSLISELQVSRKTVNLLTDDQILILNKMGKYMGDFYYYETSRNGYIKSSSYKNDNLSPEIRTSKSKPRYKKLKHVVKMYNGGGNMSFHK